MRKQGMVWCVGLVAMLSAACGGGVPTCSDPEVQGLMKQVMAEWTNGWTDGQSGILFKMFEKLKAQPITPEMITISNVRSDAADKEAKKVVCIVDTDMSDESWVAKARKAEPVLFDDFLERVYDKQGRLGPRKGVKFTAQATDEGKVVVTLGR